MKRILTLLSLGLSLCLLSGCGDPFLWQHSWDAEQVNQINLAVQAADWHDLAHGRGDPGADGQEAAVAVERLRRGMIKPLPSTEITSVAAQGNSNSASPTPTGGN